MRAKHIYESDNRLKIYKNSDGSYSATRDSLLYTFLWNNFKVYNFKKVGKINTTYVDFGKLITNPHIQMILQVQKNIGKLNEGSGSVLRPKSEEEMQEAMFKGPGFYALFIVFDDKKVNIEFSPIYSKEKLSEFLNHFKDYYSEDYGTIDLVKIDTTQQSSIDNIGSDSYDGTWDFSGDGLQHIIRFDR